MRSARALPLASPLLALLAALHLGLACAPPAGGDAGTLDAGDVDAGPPDTGYELPLDDVVPRVGTPETLDVATWNIENFPLAATTPKVVADLITSLGLDVIAVQEIASESAFTELVTRLPYHRGALSGHAYSDGSYQKVGYIYREDLVEVSDVTMIFSGAGNEFPRPPLQARVSVKGTDFDFTIITLHLKAGIGFEDRDRRDAAVDTLIDYVGGMIDGPADDEVMLLGDFNEVVTSSAGQEVFGQLLTNARFTVQTVTAASQGQRSYLPSGAILDHVVTTSALDEEVTAGVTIPRVDTQLQAYGSVSDHLPVVLAMPVLP